MGDGAPAADGDPHVQRSFALGWNMAQLFHGEIPSSTPRGTTGAGGKLPGISDLDPLARVRLLLSEVVVGVHRVCTFRDEGLPALDLRPLETLFGARSRKPDDVRSAMTALHRTLLAYLTAADFRLGKAYGLGRALAETTMVPSADDRETFTEPFDPHRMKTLESWLSDLKSLFPAHATEGVRGSLRTWAAWVTDPTIEKWSACSGEVGAKRQVNWDSDDDQRRITAALGRQAQVWRALLSGEKLGVDLLSTEHYVRAGEQLVDRLGELLGQFLMVYKFVLGGAVLLVVAVVGVISYFSLSSAITAGAVTAVGAIGISWKGVGGTLGKALGRAERPLWDAALDVSIVIAATRVPQEVTHEPAPKRRRWPPHLSLVGRDSR